MKKLCLILLFVPSLLLSQNTSQWSGSGGSAITAEDEGSSLGEFTILDAVGAGVTATLSGGQLTLTIPGGGSATFTVQENDVDVSTAISILDFLGVDFDVTESPAGEANIVIAAAIARDSELHSAVTVSGVPDYFTLSGQDLIRGLIDLTTDITGILPDANTTDHTGEVAGGTALTITKTITPTWLAQHRWADTDFDSLVIDPSGFNATNPALAGNLAFLLKDISTSLFSIDTTGTILNGIWNGTALADAFVNDNITLTNMTQITTRNHSDLLGIGANDHHNSVTLAGENYLSLATQVITANAVNLAGTNVTGILPVLNGGSGSSTASGARTNFGLVIGTDVLAFQTIGIADNNLLEVDGIPNALEYARFTAFGLEGRTEAEFKADFNLEAGIDYEVDLSNEAGLYAVLSDVTNFLQTGDAIAGDDITDNTVDASEIEPDAIGESELIEAMNFSPTGNWDYSAATRGIPRGITLPATCAVGDEFMDTDATTGQRFFLCETVNTWVLQGDGGAAEVNNLETTDPPNVLINEFYIGTGAGTGAWAVLSGDVTNVAGAITVIDNAIGSNEIDLSFGPIWTGSHTFQPSFDLATFQMMAFSNGNRTTATDGDEFFFDYQFEEDTGSQATFVRAYPEAVDVTSTTKDGGFRIEVMSSNVLTNAFHVQSDVTGAITVNVPNGILQENGSPVFTLVDGQLNDDDVTLADVQTATTSDFHNIGGTDDDVPEAGDFGAATDLDANGALLDDSVQGNDLSFNIFKAFVITDPVATSDYPLWRAPYNYTIQSIHVLVEGGTNVIGGLDEADANGNTPVAVDVDITGTAGTNANDDGTLTNPTIDTGDYILWHTTSISGTPTSITVTVELTID